MPQPRIPCTEPHGFDPFERSEPAVPSENTIRRGSSGSTLVPMVQSPDLGESDDLSKLSLVRRSRIGRVLLEREVSAGAVVVLPVVREDSAEMPLVENDYVVQALSAQGSNESLRVVCQNSTERNPE